jgi:hypothetical protein
MARHPHGGTVADYAVTDGGGGAVVFDPDQPVLFYTAHTGGSQITDLASDAAGASPVSETATDSTGAVIEVYGPDGVLGMWASCNGGARVFVLARDAADVITANSAGLASLLASFSAHTAAANGHGTAVADLVDVNSTARADGYLFGYDLATGKHVYVPPSVAAGAVLLNPPLSSGVYVGNLVTAPSGTSSGNPWLDVRLPYSASDDNPDFRQIHVYHSDGVTRIKSSWDNGNGEGRWAPSTRGRIAARVFESYESIGAVSIGASTGRFFELSTNPANTANREPLLGAYGTASTTKPGWIEATRILSALLGVAAGGSYNSLGQLIFRGRRASTGAPSSGTWAQWDVVVDSAGALWMCTVAGTPGTWVGGGGSGNVSGSWSDVTPGTSVAHGTVHGSVRLDNTGDSASPVRMRGSLTISGTITSGTTVFTVPTGFRPTWDSVIMIRNTGSSTNLVMTVATTGAVTFGSGLSSGMVLVFDGITWTLT